MPDSLATPDTVTLNRIDDLLILPQAFLVVAVISAPRNAERRRAIRETWLNLERHLRAEVIHFFVVGRKGLHSEILQSLEAESAENKVTIMIQGGPSGQIVVGLGFALSAIFRHLAYLLSQFCQFSI